MSESLASVPSKPSNRQFIQQLQLWGCKQMKVRGPDTEMKFPDGSRMQVSSALHYEGNGQRVFQDAYKRLGVTAHKFWTFQQQEAPRPVATTEAPKKRQRRTSDNKQPNNRGLGNAILDLLMGQGPMSIQRIAEMLGVSSSQAGQACAYLASKGSAERVKTGFYKAVEQRPADHRVELDIDVGTKPNHLSLVEPVDMPEELIALTDDHDAPVEITHPEPVRPNPTRKVHEDTGAEEQTTVHADERSDRDIDELIWDFLDMVFPQGFRGRHMPAIMQWQEATKLLFQQVREQ